MSSSERPNANDMEPSVRAEAEVQELPEASLPSIRTFQPPFGDADPGADSSLEYEGGDLRRVGNIVNVRTAVAGLH